MLAVAAAGVGGGTGGRFGGGGRMKGDGEDGNRKTASGFNALGPKKNVLAGGGGGGFGGHEGSGVGTKFTG